MASRITNVATRAKVNVIGRQFLALRASITQKVDARSAGVTSACKPQVIG
jgi:hypothetical protein